MYSEAVVHLPRTGPMYTPICRNKAERSNSSFISFVMFSSETRNQAKPLMQAVVKFVFELNTSPNIACESARELGAKQSNRHEKCIVQSIGVGMEGGLFSCHFHSLTAQ